MELLTSIMTGICFIFALLLGKLRHKTNLAKNNLSIKWIIWSPIALGALGYFVLFMENKLSLMEYIIQWGRLCVLQLALIYVIHTLYNRVGGILWSCIMLLITLGLIVLTRINPAMGNRQYYFILIGMVLSIILAFLGYFIDVIYRLKWVYIVLSLFVLSTVLFIGIEKNGANNWITLGPIVLQPAEFVKIFYILFLASLKPKKTNDFWILTFFTLIIMGMLVAQVDLGTALILFGIYFVFVYLITSNIKINILLLTLGGFATVFAYYSFAHVRTRFISFTNPFEYIETKGYQIVQSLFSIAAGGWFGTGLGNGMPEKIPVVYTDFIYAAICEEFGAVMGITLVLLYTFLAIYLINLSLRLKETQYILFIVGVSGLMLFQTFLIVGGVIKMLPLTGVTLPLISGGGSSIISFLVLLGLVQSILLRNESEVIG